MLRSRKRRAIGVQRDLNKGTGNGVAVPLQQEFDTFELRSGFHGASSL